MLLLPGSLPPDRATLVALCDGLAALPEIASTLQNAVIAEYSGSWSDIEREAAGNPGDLHAGAALAQEVLQSAEPTVGLAEAVRVAIATPLHAALGLTDLTPSDPSMLSLSTDESRLLCGAADVHMREDGVRLHFVDAARWLVTCTRAVEVFTERPDWIVGEMLRPNLPRGRDARLVERWMNELQMLLHTHPVNVEREARRLQPVNLVWLWGFGSLDFNNDVNAVGGTPTAHPSHVGQIHALRQGDVSAWQKAWQTRSAQILSANTIILGDTRPRLRLTVNRPSITERLLSPFKRKATLAEVLARLQQSQ